MRHLLVAPIISDVELMIRPFTRTEARRASLWKYGPPWEIYDNDPADMALFTTLDEDGLGYYALVRHEQELVGFCCFGQEARVRGQVDELGTLDIGGGIRPDLTSQGLATGAFSSLLRFGKDQFRPVRFRIAVATFNERSMRLCLAAGFSVTRVFVGPGREFCELVRPVGE